MEPWSRGFEGQVIDDSDSGGEREINRNIRLTDEYDSLFLFYALNLDLGKPN